MKNVFLHSPNIHQFWKLNVSGWLVNCNILVAKYVKIPAGRPLFFLDVIYEQSSKLFILAIMFACNFLYQQKFQTNGG